MNENEVIDLTQSYTYRRAPLYDLACSVIEINDSITEESINSPRSAITPAGPIVVDRETESLPAVNFSQETQSKKSKTTKKKRQSRASVPATTSSIRERSPRVMGDCPICRDPLGTNPMAATNCGHVYCKQCIEKAVKIEKKCPTCRKPLKGVTAYHPLFL